jgi:glycosyltransferase involved in cell wall biosynthesis
VPSPNRRILFVTSNFPRWSGDNTTPFVLDLATDLQSLGWEVDVLAPNAPGAAHSEVLSGVHVERFRYLVPQSAETICYQGGALINLRRTPSNWIKLPALVTAEFFSLLRRLLSGHYALVHSHWVLPQGFVASLAAQMAGVPHIATAHGSDVFDLNGRFLTGFKRYALSRADRVTANSDATATVLKKIGADAARLRRIPMGIRAGSAEPDQTSVATNRAHFRMGGGPALIFAGRLVREKGLRELIEAVEILTRQLPDVTLTLVGEGPDRSELEALAQNLGVVDRVRFTGWCAPSEIPACLAAADYYVGPSHREAQGLSLLEAMAAGIPVIASRVGGIPEIVREGESGLLVAPKAPQDIAEAVLRLVGDSSLRDRLRDGGLAVISDGYSRENSAHRFDALYGEVLSSAVPRS